MGERGELGHEHKYYVITGGVEACSLLKEEKSISL